MKKKTFLARAAMTLALAVLTSTGAWADDVTLSVDEDFAEGTAGHYYVNLPRTGTNTLTLTDASITSFMVYDDGGKNGTYSNDCSGALNINAPSTDDVLQVTGTVKTD